MGGEGKEIRDATIFLTVLEHRASVSRTETLN